MSQHCKHILQELSDYQDGALSAKAHQEVAEHLAGCEECAVEDRDLRRAVRLLNHLPMPEPRLDLWQEFSVKMAEVEAEHKMGPIARASSWWQHAQAHVAEGLVLFTHVVAHRTLTRMERYLIRDPFRVSDQTSIF